MHTLSMLIITVIEVLERITHSYGMGILLFAVLLKVALLPVTFYGMRWQERFKKAMSKATEEIAAITVSDPAAHDDEILRIYRKNGINFVNQCKALLPLLIQLPLLIAFYRTVVHWDVMETVSFLWMQDMSRPDNLYPLGISLPWMGSSVNLLPCMLFAVNATEVVLFHESKLQFKSFSLPLIFFFLFYPFPASCMIFWVMLNVLHLPELFLFRKLRARLPQTEKDTVI